jgi:hypothetical protein
MHACPVASTLTFHFQIHVLQPMRISIRIEIGYQFDDGVIDLTGRAHMHCTCKTATNLQNKNTAVQHPRQRANIGSSTSTTKQMAWAKLMRDATNSPLSGNSMVLSCSNSFPSSFSNYLGCAEDRSKLMERYTNSWVRRTWSMNASYRTSSMRAGIVSGR